MLVLSAALRQRILAHCSREAPDEACGILAGSTEGERETEADNGDADDRPTRRPLVRIKA